MIVINLFGEPGAGKSTAATYIFAMLKMQGIKCEYVSEFAKDMVWDEDFKALENQPYVFGCQSYRLSRIANEVDVAITDCPLLLSAVYNRDPIFIANTALHEDFKKLVVSIFKSYDNINVLLDRQHEYEDMGRHESEEEALEVRKMLCRAFNKYDVAYEEYPAQLEAYDKIVDLAVERLKEINISRNETVNKTEKRRINHFKE